VFPIGMMAMPKLPVPAHDVRKRVYRICALLLAIACFAFATVAPLGNSHHRLLGACYAIPQDIAFRWPPAWMNRGCGAKEVSQLRLAMREHEFVEGIAGFIGQTRPDDVFGGEQDVTLYAGNAAARQWQDTANAYGAAREQGPIRRHDAGSGFDLLISPLPDQAMGLTGAFLVSSRKRQLPATWRAPKCWMADHAASMRLIRCTFTIRRDPLVLRFTLTADNIDKADAVADLVLARLAAWRR